SPSATLWLASVSATLARPGFFLLAKAEKVRSKFHTGPSHENILALFEVVLCVLMLDLPSSGSPRNQAKLSIWRFRFRTACSGCFRFHRSYHSVVGMEEKLGGLVNTKRTLAVGKHGHPVRLRTRNQSNNVGRARITPCLRLSII